MCHGWASGESVLKYSQRLSRVEKVLAPRLQALTRRVERAAESQSEFDRAWAFMCATEHAQLVVDAYARGLQDVRHPEWNSPEGVLLRRCLDALHGRRHWPHKEIPPEVGFAMPPVVADVYLRDGALPLHECEDCGYKLPHGYFDACPLCDGRIGYEAYFKRRKAEQVNQ